MTRLLIRLDPSSIVLWGCPRKFQLTNMLGYTPKLGKTPLDFGQALHRGVAEFHRDRARGVEINVDRYAQLALDYYTKQLCVKNAPRDVDNLAHVIRDYVKAYETRDTMMPLVNEKGDIGVELPFEFKEFYVDNHVEIRLCGVIDMVGMDKGLPRLRDLKHTASDPKYHMQTFLRSPQFMIYSWALRKIGWVDAYVPAIVDAVYISKDYRGAKLYRSEAIDMLDYQVDRVMARVQQICRGISEQVALDVKEFPHDFSQCRNDYPSCQFDPICNGPEFVQKFALTAAYNQREYNPATFGE